MRVSPEGILMMANFPSRDISWAYASGTADHFGTLTGTKFDVMNDGTERNLTQVQGISDFRRYAFTG